MEEIKINKTLNFKEGSIEVRYNGIPKSDDIDLEKIETLLNDFINNHNHNDMVENVAIVRTILKDCEEKLLVVFYQDGNDSELVKYDNSNLFLYEKSSQKDNNKYKIKYTPHYMNLDYIDHETNIVDNYNFVSEEITKILQNIYRLKNVSTILLDDKSKIIIELYKLFYNEAPDFSSKDINDKIQAMSFILECFGIFVSSDFGFGLNEKNIPCSTLLEQHVNDLYPYGKIDSEYNESLSPDVKMKIQIITESIRKNIENKLNFSEAVINISKVIYASNHVFPATQDVNTISQFLNSTPEEVESYMKLTRGIKNNIIAEAQ